MEKQKVVMFLELCRLCLENAGAVDVFETEDLLDDIFTFITLKMTENDKLQRKICTRCCDIITNIKNLKTLATTNDSHLKSLFGEEEQEELVLDDPLSITNSPQTITIRDRILFENDSDEMQENDKKCDESLSNHSTNSPKKENMFNASSVVNISTRRSSSESVTPNGDKKRTKIKTEPEDLQCKICQKKFGTPKKLYLHHRLHSKKILCPLDACAKRFATKGDLEKHIRTHTGEKPYKCDVCKKSFAQKVTLKAHIDAVHESGHKDRQKS